MTALHFYLVWYGEHWVLGTILLCFMLSVIHLPFRLLYNAYNRTLRSRNIREKGWPPAHLDGDGDWDTKD